MSRWPNDPRRFTPSARWFGVIVVAILVGIFGVVGVFMWTSFHHRALVDELSGNWVEVPASGAARLSIAEETKTYEFSASEQTTRATGALLVSGQIEGRPASGRIVVPDLPPWSTTVRTTLLGEGWTLSSSGPHGRLTATSDSGRVITFSPAP